MLWKRFARKPLFALLFLAELVVSVLFLSFQEQSMQANREAVDALYHNARIQCQLMPSSVMSGTLAVSPFSAQMLLNRKEVDSCYCSVWNPVYLVGDGAPRGENTFIAYGTNDLSTFFEKMGLTCTFAEGYTVEDFCQRENVCLMDATLADLLSYRLGDTIALAGADENAEYSESASVQQLTLVGIYPSSIRFLGALIVPEANIYTQGQKRIVYSDATRLRWYVYSQFSFTLNPAYNAQFDAVAAEIQQWMDAMRMDCTLYANTRELEEALRPLENKLKLQQTLHLPIRCAFIALAAVLAVLMTHQEQSEILIRRLHGEPSLRLFLGLWLSLCGLLLALSLPAALLGYAAGGAQSGLLAHWLLTLAVCVMACAAVLTLLCGRRLLSLYQGFQRDA